jgi:hypothetical protein
MLYHAYHTVRALIEETKVGGVLAVLGIAVAGYLAFTSNPASEQPADCTNGLHTVNGIVMACHSTINWEALVGNLFIVVGGGVIGICIAALLVSLGIVKKETIGFHDEEL